MTWQRDLYNGYRCFTSRVWLSRFGMHSLHGLDRPRLVQSVLEPAQSIVQLSQRPVMLHVVRLRKCV